MNMKIDELKLRVAKFIDETIDMYIPPVGFFDKLKNSTIKLWAHQNMWKLNKVMDAFKDENGEICQDDIIREYEGNLFENGEFRLDLKSLIPQEYSDVANMLPNKIVVFRREDLYHLFGAE